MAIIHPRFSGTVFISQFHTIKMPCESQHSSIDSTRSSTKYHTQETWSLEVLIYRTVVQLDVCGYTGGDHKIETL